MTCDVLTLRLGGETMAVPAECLREILEPVEVTRVPNAENFAAGLINVRGSVVPLADLRVAFRIPADSGTEDTRMVVLEVRLKGAPMVVAILADKVHEVVSLEFDENEELPPVGLSWPPEYVRGICNWRGDFVLLPNLETVFSRAVSRGAAGASDEVQ